ncbi:glutathione S-transferase family protein [Nitratireductor rhodophyticola]|uniref:glutathione S-transferase family protein n=1 Tax=Nitratireductor rhodophyticola TaxID=2854036 RepID=UPI00300BDE1D
MLTLYHAWDSLQSFKVRVCLAELDVPWEDRSICLTEFEHLQPEYLQLNADGLVPTLICQGQPLGESSVINAFLDETYGRGRLHPQDAMARARMRWWCHCEDSVVHPAIRSPTFNLYIKPLLSSLSAEELERRIAAHPLPERAGAFRSAVTAPFDRAAVVAAIRTLHRTIGRMNEVLLEAEWLAGDRFSLADVAMSALVDRLKVLGLSTLWRAHPAARRWADQMAARPSFAVAGGEQEHKVTALVEQELCASLIKDALPPDMYAKIYN